VLSKATSLLQQQQQQQQQQPQQQQQQQQKSVLHYACQHNRVDFVKRILSTCSANGIQEVLLRL
jgi:myosin-crossreactive antigen